MITSPGFIPGEASLIVRLFDCGLDILHLRKPDTSVADCARLLDALPDRCRRRIVVHDHFVLCRDYGLKGVHLNRRNPLPPSDVCGLSLSASCHSIAEVASRKPSADYVFMSPIFDSISKQGYMSAYSTDELDRAASECVIDDRVVALGGVTLGNIPQLKRWHFGGAAFLGDVWNHANLPTFDAHASELSAALRSAD